MDLVVEIKEGMLVCETIGCRRAIRVLRLILSTRLEERLKDGSWILEIVVYNIDEV